MSVLLKFRRWFCVQLRCRYWSGLKCWNFCSVWLSGRGREEKVFFLSNGLIPLKSDSIIELSIAHLVEQLPESLKLSFELTIVILKYLHSSFQSAFVLSQKFRFRHHILWRFSRLESLDYSHTCWAHWFYLLTPPWPFVCPGVLSESSGVVVGVCLVFNRSYSAWSEAFSSSRSRMIDSSSSRSSTSLFGDFGPFDDDIDDWFAKWCSSSLSGVELLLVPPSTCASLDAYISSRECMSLWSVWVVCCGLGAGDSVGGGSSVKWQVVRENFIFVIIITHRQPSLLELNWYSHHRDLPRASPSSTLWTGRYPTRGCFLKYLRDLNLFRNARVKSRTSSEDVVC